MARSPKRWILAGSAREDKESPPRLGRMYEDAQIEINAFPPGSSIFCVGSAGCTALRLTAAGFRVCAVDPNPAQVGYIDYRIRFGQFLPGDVDRKLSVGRRMLRLLGFSQVKVQKFLTMRDTERQFAFWNKLTKKRQFQWAMRLICTPRFLEDLYRLPKGSGGCPHLFNLFLKRVETGFQLHPNRDNPFAWYFWNGTAPLHLETSPSDSPRFKTHCADPLEFLENSPPNRFGGFSLSNVMDGVTPEYGKRLQEMVTRTAVQGAKVVFRSLNSSADPLDKEWARNDRSAFWGTVGVKDAKSWLSD